MANKDVLVLKDNTSIELETGASLINLQVYAADRAAMLATWEKLIPNNLSAVQIKSGDNLVVGNYTDLVLVSETSVVAADGTVLTTYCLREKTDVEKRLDALETSQDVQNGAINDLGAVTSTIAEQMEGGQA